MLVEHLLTTASSRPSAPALSDPTVRLSYRQATALAAALRRLVQERTQLERVGIMLPASAGFAAGFFGTLWAGKVAVPLNFLLPKAELAGVVADARIDLILAHSFFAELCESLGTRTVYLDRLNLKARTLWSLLRRTPPAPRVASDDTAAIVYTSGTSGQPKGVCLSHRNLAANATACIEHARIDPRQQMLGLLPPFHCFGLTATVVIPLLLGAEVHYLPRFSPAGAARAIQQRRTTVAMAIPSMWAAIGRVKDLAPDAFASLTHAVSGGERLPPAVFETFRERYGVSLLEGYGLTETAPVSTLNPPHDNRPGTVGTALPQVEVKTIDDHGAETPRGVPGELWVRGPHVMQGYFGRDDLTAEVVTDRWFRTGDIATIDDDGFVRITGRKKDMMIIGGENVWPRQIEDVLQAHPAVAETAVIGVADASRGEVPVAFVLLREGAEATPEALRTHCRDRLAGYKVPRRVHVLDELPRTPTGKVLKRALREP